jgi:hypothetical protein
MRTRSRRVGRRRYALRRLAAALTAAFVLAVIFGLIRSCGPEAGAPPDEGNAGSTDGLEEAGTTGETTAAGGEETTGEVTGEARDGAAEPREPYAAIPPPADARVTEPASALVEGAEDLSDGPLKENRIVAYYGTPQSGYMGVLGESAPEAMMAQLKEQAAAYSAVDPSRPAIPTVELIASVAQRDPGPYGIYLSRMPHETIERYAKLAEENRALLLLDVQIGLSTLPYEVEYLMPFLERPYVHLAIDTEYAVAPGQVPGVDLGGVSGYDIQKVVEFLDRLVEERNLPDKVVVVHQFASGIVFDKEAIRPTENVQVVLHADGFGSPENKFSKYDQLVAGQPIQYGGFKLFYTQDAPLLTPEQALDQTPAPVVISYQ